MNRDTIVVGIQDNDVGSRLQLERDFSKKDAIEIVETSERQEIQYNITRKGTWNGKEVNSIKSVCPVTKLMSCGSK